MPPKVMIIDINGSMISMVFNIPVMMLLKKKIAPTIIKINVIEITCVWVVFKSSLIGLGYLLGISNSSFTIDPLKCSEVPEVVKLVV